MQQAESKWMRTLRAEVKRSSVRKTAKRIGYADITVRLVLTGRYTHSQTNIAARVLERLKPSPKPRLTRSPQFKDAAPLLHARLKPKYRLWGPVIVSRWYNVEPEQLDRLMRGHAKHGVTEFIAAVEHFGIPEAPACKVCGGAL